MQTVVHAAGLLGKDAITDVTPERFWEVCAPKLAAAPSLTAAPLQELHLLTSTAGAWSQPGACHYSAANAALDAFRSQLRYASAFWLTIINTVTTHHSRTIALPETRLSSLPITARRGWHETRTSLCKSGNICRHFLRGGSDTRLGCLPDEKDYC